MLPWGMHGISLFGQLNAANHVSTLFTNKGLSVVNVLGASL